MLDNRVTVIQIMCIRERQYINYMCFEVHQVIYPGLCCVWSGEGVGGRGGGVEEFAIFSDGFF